MKINCPFKNFRDIFGKPNTGIHKIKLGDTSITFFIFNFHEDKTASLP